jgi:DNA primase
VIGFGGRVLGNDKPKYLNSPETLVFRKGEELYGLYEAKKKLRNIERFLIVEGYMDVIALAQSGIHYSVATLGTATSASHLRILFKHAPEVVFCFDGDNAGREAAWRALQQCLPLLEDGRSARFLFLPEGQDPDTQVRTIGARAFEASLDAATRLPDFFFDTLTARLDMQSLEGKARLGKTAVPFLDKLPKGIFRQLMMDELAKRTGLDNTAFHKPEPAAQPDLPPAPPSDFAPARQPRPKSPPIRSEWTPCMKAVNLLIRKPALIKQVTIDATLGEIRTPDMDLLLNVIELALAWPDSTTTDFMGRIYATAYGNQLTQLLSREQITPEEGIEQEFQEILDKLLKGYRERQQKAEILSRLKQHHADINSETKLPASE